MSEDATFTVDSHLAARVIHELIVSYFDAFGRDPAAAASFYSEPSMFVTAKNLRILQSSAEVQTVLAKTLVRLKGLDYSHSRICSPRVKMLNTASALYAALALRLKADDSVLEQLPVTYLLHNGSRGWKIHAFIVTEADALLTGDGCFDPA